MGWHDHPPKVVAAVATPDLGTRVLAYWRDLGLTDDQKDEILALLREWREEYGGHLARITELADEVKALVEARPLRPGDCYSKIDEHCSAIKALERAYADAVARLTDLLGEDQRRAAEEIYLSEKSSFPLRPSGVL